MTIDLIVYQLLIYFITLFGITQVLFFSPILKVGLPGIGVTMEFLGYTTTEWFLMAALLGVGSFWLSLMDDE